MKQNECLYCYNGNFHGADIECVNGVMIDIDVAHECRRTDEIYPAAPCISLDGKWPNGDIGCQARLDDWADTGPSDLV